MKLIGKLSSNDTSKIGILTSASKYVSIKISDKYVQVLNNKEILNDSKAEHK